MTQHIPIRRDGTFEYKGVRYFTSQGSDTPNRDGSRYVARINSDEPGDWEEVAQGFGYLSEVRDFIARAIAEDWDDLDEIGNDSATTSQGGAIAPEDRRRWAG